MKRTVLLAVLASTGILALGAAALTGGPGNTPPDARRTVPAPIDGLEVVIRESAPPQVSLKVTAGLPGGCAQEHSHQLTRSGNAFIVTVLNSMPTGDVACTMIYGSYALTIDLGKDFAPGQSYTVQVNDRSTSFKT